MSNTHSIHTNYEALASGYDGRYPIAAALEARGQALLGLANEVRAVDALEVGCGTAHWLDGLSVCGARLCGLDFSRGMLQKAALHGSALRLVEGSAVNLPFNDGTFDIVYCVDALHHFGDPRRFILDAYRTLRPGGVLASIGNDPHSGKVSWYGYDYFPTTLATDLVRFTPHPTLMQWMAEAGFAEIHPVEVENLQQLHHGREIYNDPFLARKATSQFALLSDDQYHEGLRNIDIALANAEQEDREIVFESQWPVVMLRGTKR